MRVFFRTVLIATVPKLPYPTPLIPVVTPATRFTHHDMLNVLLKRDQIERYATREVLPPLDDDVDDFEIRLCHSQFCCEFKFNITFQPVPLGKVTTILLHHGEILIPYYSMEPKLIYIIIILIVLYHHHHHNNPLVIDGVSIPCRCFQWTTYIRWPCQWKHPIVYNICMY